MSNVITAEQAEAGKVYKTAESELSYFTKLVGKKDDKMVLTVFMPKTGKWKEMETPLSYKLRDLEGTEAEAYAALDKGIGLKKARVKKERAPGQPVAKKEKGKISGLGMIAGWAKYIGQFADQEGGRTKTIQAMVADFPDKADSINRWVDAYLTYYNTGRFERHGVPRQVTSKVWKLNAEETAAGIKAKAPKVLGEKKKKAEPTPAAAQ